MINFYNQVPTIYNNASRDFQYLSNLINIVLNSVKHNVDDLYNLPNTQADDRLTELLAMTLGFKIKRNYDKNQLAILVSILPSILKHKGSEKAVRIALDALVASSGAVGDTDLAIKNNCLEVRLPESFSDKTLFIDLLPYIMPAGLTVHIIVDTYITADGIDSIEVGYSDKLHSNWFADVSWNTQDLKTEGLAGLYEASNANFANFKNYTDSDDSGPINLNAGLLDNTIIPVLTQPLYNKALNQSISIEEGEETHEQ